MHFTHHSEDLLIELNNQGTHDGLSFFGGETSLRWKKDTPKVGILGFFPEEDCDIQRNLSKIGRFLLKHIRINNLMIFLWEVVLPNCRGTCFSSDEAQAITEVGLRSNRWGSLSTSTQMKANIPYVEQTWECEF